MSKPIAAHFIRGFLRPTETFIGNQIISLQKYDPKVFCHHRIEGHSFPQIVPYVVIDELNLFEKTVENISYRIYRTLSSYGAKKLAYAVSQQNPKLLHFHYLVEARYYLSVARKLQLPCIVSGYGWDVSLFPTLKYGYGKIYLQPIFREMDLFLAMSDDMKKDIIALGCPENKVIVHYFGTKTQRFKYPGRLYSKKEKLNILFCGRLATKKAPQLILHALKICEDENLQLPQWELMFVGDGPLRNELEALVNANNWNHKVTFTGHIPYGDDRFIEQYKNADIYIQPSITANAEKEGIPGTVIEAMASGLPVISTYHAGIPYVINNKITGLLVKENNERELADAIKKLMVSRSQREYLGKTASQYATTNLELSEKTKELESIYDLLV